MSLRDAERPRAWGAELNSSTKYPLLKSLYVWMHPYTVKVYSWVRVWSWKVKRFSQEQRKRRIYNPHCPRLCSRPKPWDGLSAPQIPSALMAPLHVCESGTLGWACLCGSMRRTTKTAVLGNQSRFWFYKLGVSKLCAQRVIFGEVKMRECWFPLVHLRCISIVLGWHKKQKVY